MTTPDKTRTAVPEVEYKEFALPANVELTPRKSGGGRTLSPYMENLVKLLQKHHNTQKPASVVVAKDEKTVAAMERKLSGAATRANVGLRMAGYVGVDKNTVAIAFYVVDRTKRPRKNKTSE